MDFNEFIQLLPEFNLVDLSAFNSARLIAKEIIGCFDTPIKTSLAIAHILELRQKSLCSSNPTITQVKAKDEALTFRFPKDDRDAWLSTTLYGSALLYALNNNPTFITL